MKIIDSRNTPDMIPTGKVAVTIYINQRYYGGPEEGGWWYISPIVARTYLFGSVRKAKVFMRNRDQVFANLVTDGILDPGDRFGRGAHMDLEFPGLAPTEVDSDGHLVSARPYHLRQVYRDRELLCRPHYC